MAVWYWRVMVRRLEVRRKEKIFMFLFLYPAASPDGGNSWVGDKVVSGWVEMASSGFAGVSAVS